MSTRDTFWIGLMAALGACTQVELTSLGLEGDLCFQDAECETGFVCVAQTCSKPGTSDATSTDADAGLGDVPTPQETTVIPDASDVPEDDGDAPEVADVELPPEVIGDAEDAEILDVEEDAEIPDVEEDAEIPDVEEDAEIPDVEEDLPEPDVIPDVEDAGPLPPPGPGEECIGPCAAGLTCALQGDGSFACQQLEGGLCLPCEVDADCPSPSAKCLQYPSGGQRCGIFCLPNVGCPVGFSCISSQCRSEAATCDCGENTLGFEMGCSTSTEEATCLGAMVCTDAGWGPCSAQLPSVEVCDYQDNDCNGVVDDGVAYQEAGQDLQVGQPCGLGVCVGGAVVCENHQPICSTLDLASQEFCADTTDDDCDGLVNEGCVSEDIDGDGVPNAEDCEPFEAAIHAGAFEPCCDPTDAPFGTCDLNCDGQVTPCEECDQDADGYCPDEDCDDSDPMVNPGSPDKCNDDIDQDCQGGPVQCGPGKDLDADGYAPPADCNESDPEILPWGVEVCDNIDNDCDGVTDEGNPGGGAVCGTDPTFCYSGLTVCTHYGYGAIVECQGAVAKADEICDGLDNDCDDQVDEAWPELGQACDGPDTDECPNGLLECSADGVGTVCGEEALTNITEECNFLDDDCDGATDEFPVCPIEDLDGDGYTIEDGDCDDHRSEIHPGALEPCCPIGADAATQVLCDWNCSNDTIPCDPNDGDGDGYKPPADCDDTDPTISPKAKDKCDDDIDQNCDGVSVTCSAGTDNDGDGFLAGADCNDSNPDIHPWGTEVCNFQDDDCDGLTDEENPTELQGDCGTQTAECEIGTWVCVHDLKGYSALEICVNPKFQEIEVCNDLDDDCDGSTDESFFDLGEPCDGGDPDLCENGQLVCGPSGEELICGNEPTGGLVEICNDLDDDCDNDIDEDVLWKGQGKGESCNGEGGCGIGIVVCNAAQQATCSTNPDGPLSQALPEICDGIDNDCDEVVDESFTYGGIPIGELCVGQGECGEGVVECLDEGVATCSSDLGASASQALPEACDGLDNDCDGLTDEDVDPAASGCKSLGICTTQEVVAECVGGSWTCDYGGVPGYEDEELSCDGLDNDCDNVTDETWPIGEDCDGEDEDLCASGQWTCTVDLVDVECVNETLENQVDECDGLDNDCDGFTDELDGLSAADGNCVDTGVCGNQDFVVVVCAGQGTGCDFQGVPGFEENEVSCDNLDNDCDGEIDEGLQLNGALKGEACEGEGACGPGVMECHPVDLVPMCSTEALGQDDQSVSESCQGLDDDCDGEVDEDFTLNELPIGAPCDGLGVCGSGTVECGPSTIAKAICSSGPGGTGDASAGEECDGQDNDCDGLTDEAEELAPKPELCPTEGVCADPSLKAICVDGSWTCPVDQLPDYEPGETRCDGLDNDCDGLFDEGYPTKGNACDGDDVDLCASGQWICAPSGQELICDGDFGQGIAESCDGLDNDCDNQVDEELAWNEVPLGEICDGFGLCGVGIVECRPDGGVTCSTQPDGSVGVLVEEACNGQDDDCDDAVDEGLEWQGVPLGGDCQGLGACGAGQVICSALTVQVTCSSQPDALPGFPCNIDDDCLPGKSCDTNVGICIPRDDCDGVDDDCDGETDEAFSDHGNACDGNGDGCATGFFACVDSTTTCLNDVLCAAGTECIQNPGAIDYCWCNGVLCNVKHGNNCGESGCLCSGGLACTPGQFCVPGSGCQ